MIEKMYTNGSIVINNGIGSINTVLVVAQN